MDYVIEKRHTIEYRVGKMTVSLIGCRVRCAEGVGLWLAIVVGQRVVHHWWHGDSV